MNNRRKIIIIIAVSILVTAVVTVGGTLGFVYVWNYLHPKYEIYFDASSVNIDNIRKFNEVRELLKDNFYQNVDENAMVEGAISGMADSLKDPYTVYFTKEQMGKFNELFQKTQEDYVGIGVTVTLDNNGILTIIEPFEDSPARKEGIMQGDKIIKVDDQDVTVIRDEDIIINMIKGKEGTKVKITVYRPSEGKSIDFNITRKKIKYVKNIKSDLIENKYGYIRISSFDNDIYKNFNEDLDKLLEKGIKGLIIDLRDDLGGTYDQVVAIADRLLPEGTIVYTEDKFGKREYKKSDARELKLPIVVLINENSASASEILAAAIKENNKGRLVGKKTFGKGLVQVTIPLTDGSGIKVTIAKYFTPAGNYINGKGVEPDIDISTGEKFKNTPVSQIPREDDVQLKKGLEVLKGEVK